MNFGAPSCTVLVAETGMASATPSVLRSHVAPRRPAERSRGGLLIPGQRCGAVAEHLWTLDPHIRRRWLSIRRMLKPISHCIGTLRICPRAVLLRLLTVLCGRFECSPGTPRPRGDAHDHNHGREELDEPVGLGLPCSQDPAASCSTGVSRLACLPSCLRPACVSYRNRQR